MQTAFAFRDEFKVLDRISQPGLPQIDPGIAQMRAQQLSSGTDEWPAGRVKRTFCIGTWLRVSAIKPFGIHCNPGPASRAGPNLFATI